MFCRALLVLGFVVPLLSCRSTGSDLGEIKGVYSFSHEKIGADVSLTVQMYDPTDYTFEGRPYVIKDNSQQYEGQDLYCVHWERREGGYGYTYNVNPFLFIKSSDFFTIPCWYEFTRMFERLPPTYFPKGRADAYSKIKCSTSNEDKEYLECRRLNRYYTSGKERPLFKGVKLVILERTYGPRPSKDVSLSPGAEIHGKMRMEGMKQFDGQQLFCANKEFVSYHSNGVTTEYVRDHFVWAAGPKWVRCYLSKTELLESASKEAGFGSLVSCPSVAESGADVKCVFTKEIPLSDQR